MSTIHIRAAQLSDAKALSDLICENALKILKPHYSDEQWNIFIRYYSVEVMIEKIATQTVFCAERAGQIIGTVALDGDFVVGFYTHVQHVNQGIGKQLMAHLENHAYRNGITTLQLAASPEGLAFYYKNGWQKIKDLMMVHYGVGFEETLMTKQLSQI
ncbi:GNAT family N-acetyltransferase [Chitinophaga nivalis]|uniref:GNAT family N-acetyltransferase n=1 Tax=Chitinophaga nivalis TaxID=2991709 RepID=A0ABT3IN03_9BACT|nr:GNAT family N-acetyltransferase [Chitinophaga nivalis]MCW3464981.1 GNAT family N-acetyltransferase [Chitinophaga nivalis]MCW3485327.1 GNAT family N-acetyltransferase [Chitinophaga nivalis]